MQWINNKHEPGIEVGFPMTGRPRDGTAGRSRDGTEGMPRDGTVRKPRDKTILRKGIFVNRPLGPVMGEVCPVRKYE